MKKNLYKKFQKAEKQKDNSIPDYIVEKTSNLKTILLFISNFVSNLIRIIFYILIVALCSLGATFLFNYILKGGIL